MDPNEAKLDIKNMFNTFLSRWKDWERGPDPYAIFWLKKRRRADFSGTET